jgi:hypothetical protein
MKLFLTVAIATSAILLLALTLEAQGAPQAIVSEEMGKIMQELQEKLTKAAQGSTFNAWHKTGAEYGGARAQQFGDRAHALYRETWAQQFGGPRAQQLQGQSVNHLRKAAVLVQEQIMGVQILKCGSVGTIIQSALSVLDDVLDSKDFGVLVDCGSVPGCTLIAVQVPSGNLIADVGICDTGMPIAIKFIQAERIYVAHYSFIGCVRSFFLSKSCTGIFSIDVDIPVPGGGDSIPITVNVDPPILSPATCISVEANAPLCPW